jgi:hypothetical protein
MPPLVPINIRTSVGDYVRTDNLNLHAIVGVNGTGRTPPEQYVAYHPDNPASSLPIQPGRLALLRSQQTGKLCRIAAYNISHQGDNLTAGAGALLKLAITQSYDCSNMGG